MKIRMRALCVLLATLAMATLPSHAQKLRGRPSPPPAQGCPAGSASWMLGNKQSFDFLELGGGTFSITNYGPGRISVGSAWIINGPFDNRWIGGTVLAPGQSLTIRFGHCRGWAYVIVRDLDEPGSLAALGSYGTFCWE
jgi:hypothetical protein